MLLDLAKDPLIQQWAASRVLDDPMRNVYRSLKSGSIKFDNDNLKRFIGLLSNNSNGSDFGVKKTSPEEFAEVAFQVLKIFCGKTRSIISEGGAAWLDDHKHEILEIFTQAQSTLPFAGERPSSRRRNLGEISPETKMIAKIFINFRNEQSAREFLNSLATDMPDLIPPDCPPEIVSVISFHALEKILNSDEQKDGLNRFKESMKKVLKSAAEQMNAGHLWPDIPRTAHSAYAEPRNG